MLEELDFEYNGKVIKGKYQIENNILTAFINGKSKSTQLSGMRGSEEFLARLLLKEILNE